MGRGRKPTPTALRVLRGNPGRRPLPEDEPRPAAGTLEKPESLDGVASTEWDRVAQKLVDLGIVTELDQATLECYVTALSDVRQLRAAIAKDGWAIKTADGEGLKRNPLAASLREANERLRSFASELGLTPASRARLATPGKKAGTDPLEDLKQRRSQRRERSA